MRVTTRTPLRPQAVQKMPGWVRVAIAIPVVASLVLIFVLDRSTESAPVQHLYYLPIIVSGVYFGLGGALSTAIAAIGLYHLASPQLRAFHYQHWDILQGAVFVAVGVVTAVLRNAMRRLRVLAMTDDLTGLQNLRSFEFDLAALIRASAQSGTPVSLFVLDVDRLKSINDRHGHLAGADAVRTVGHVIAATVPPEALACRYGGDEFAIAVSCDIARARQIADDLRLQVQQVAPVLAAFPLPVGTLSVSVGIACGSPTRLAARAADEVAEDLFRSADTALYAAKAGGRNLVCVA